MFSLYLSDDLKLLNISLDLVIVYSTIFPLILYLLMFFLKISCKVLLKGWETIIPGRALHRTLQYDVFRDKAKKRD